MRIKFTKMQGAGNDFVVLDGVRQRITLTPGQWRRLADRHFGVGADQMLLVERSARPDVDFRYRIFNADGGEVEQCGNGARCFVRFVRDQGLTDKDVIRVETRSGVIEPRMRADGRVTVDMGAPVFDTEAIPFDPRGLRAEPVGEMRWWTLPLFRGDQVPLHEVAVAVLSMGNPHAVHFVTDVDQAPVNSEGPLIEAHPAFPNRVNAGFCQVLDRHHARLRVWERGVGETLACGTGACASAVAGIRSGLLESPVRIQARGGVLTIDWSGGPVNMTGPAESVFEGEIDLAQ